MKHNSYTILRNQLIDTDEYLVSGSGSAILVPGVLIITQRMMKYIFLANLCGFPAMSVPAPRQRSNQSPVWCCLVVFVCLFFCVGGERREGERREGERREGERREGERREGERREGERREGEGGKGRGREGEGGGGRGREGEVGGSWMHR